MPGTAISSFLLLFSTHFPEELVQGHFMCLRADRMVGVSCGYSQACRRPASCPGVSSTVLGGSAAADSLLWAMLLRAREFS